MVGSLVGIESDEMCSVFVIPLVGKPANARMEDPKQCCQFIVIIAGADGNGQVEQTNPTIAALTRSAVTEPKGTDSGPASWLPPIPCAVWSTLRCPGDGGGA